MKISPKGAKEKKYELFDHFHISGTLATASLRFAPTFGAEKKGQFE